MSQTSTLWQFSAEGRYQPSAPRGFYLAAGVGIARGSDSVGSATASQWAPLVSGALGYDIPILDFLALGIELRGAFASFDQDGAELVWEGNVKRYVYGPSSWLGLNLVGQLDL